LIVWTRLLDPFDGAKPHLLRRGKEAPLRVNPEQASAFILGSRRIGFVTAILNIYVPYCGTAFLIVLNLKNLSSFLFWFFIDDQPVICYENDTFFFIID
jgi:hypothetical protein